MPVAEFPEADRARLHRSPDLATKQDIATLEHELIAEIHRVEIRALGVIALMLAIFVLLVKA